MVRLWCGQAKRRPPLLPGRPRPSASQFRPFNLGKPITKTLTNPFPGMTRAMNEATQPMIANGLPGDSTLKGQTTMKTVTVETEDGSTLRLTLPRAVWTGREEIGTGLFRTGLFVGPKSRRVVEELDSIWEDRRTHGCIGTYYRLVTDPDHLNRLADEFAEVAALLQPEQL